MDQMENCSGKAETLIAVSHKMADCHKREKIFLFYFSSCLFLLIEELQDQSGEEQLSSRPSISRGRKSWGFRRTTIARREFLEEVGELVHSPPPVRKTRSRRSIPTPLITPEMQDSLRDTPNARSVVEELEWSAPSSPVAEDNKPATETYAGGNLDPSLWQDCGSAFHTAFSLLGGGESFQVEMPEVLAVPATAEASDSIEPYDSCVTDESAVPNNENFPGIQDGETLISEIDEMLTQKGGPELKYTTRGVKGRKGRGRPCAVDESAKATCEDAPDGEMLLREIGEMLTRKSGQEQRGTTIRGGKEGARLCTTNECAVSNVEDSPDDSTHSVLGDVEADPDVVLISPEERGDSDGEMLLRGTRKMQTRRRQEQRATTVRGVKRGKGNNTSCATGESAMLINEDSPDDIAHSSFGGVRSDTDVVLISPQEEADSDSEMTLIEIGKPPTPEIGQEQRDATARGGKGRGRKKGRGRGRKKAKGRAKGRGKAGGLQSKAMDEEVVIVNPTEEEQEVEKITVPDSPIQISASPAQSVGSLSPQQTGSQFIFIESDVDQVIGEIHEQFEDAPEQKDKEVNRNEEPLPDLDPEDHDPDALTCICCEKRNDRYMPSFLNQLRGLPKDENLRYRLVSISDSCAAFTVFRFVIRCVGCQEWFHGNCVGISHTGSCAGYVCSTCVTKNQSEPQSNCCPQLEDECSLPQGSTQSCQDEDVERKSEQQAVKVRMVFGPYCS